MQLPSSPTTGNILPSRRWLRIGVVLLLLGVSSLCGRRAEAVLVFLKGREQPLVGFLEKEDSTRLVLRAEAADGQWLLREFPRSEIEDVLYTVLPTRLLALKPENPQAYRDYAEELAEKRIDPEARAAAARLYVIAAHLAPEKLGRSSLLGLLRMTEEPTEQRRIRAMLYQIDPTHDPRLLSDSAPASGVSNPAARDQLANTLQLLRQGKLQLARTALAEPQVAATAQQLTGPVRYAELLDASRRVGRCPRCDAGSVPCETCLGRGSLRRGFRNQDCPTCGGSGKLVCQDCEGNYLHPPLRPGLLRRTLTTELSLRNSTSGETTQPTITEAPWSRIVAQQDDRPVPQLSLLTLTEFDPRESVYRDGKWVAP